jgi:UDP-glucose 4-epimerase
MNILESLNEKTVVVTGASGYIGTALVDVLLNMPCKLIRVSRSDLAPIVGVQTIKADICNAEIWGKIVDQADIVIHLAGNTSVYEAANNPSESMNATLLPITNLLKSAKEKNRRPRVVFSSTATVYGLTTRLPVAEAIKPKPVTIYDLHKFFAEQQLAFATKQNLIDGVSLRLGNVYGPSNSFTSSRDRGVLTRVASMAIKGKNLTLYGDGDFLRDYIFISDVINAILLASTTSNVGGQSFNVASGIGTTVKQVFEWVAIEAQRSTGKVVGLKSVPWPDSAAPIEFRNFVADTSKFINATGWKPLVSIKEGINLLVNELLKRECSY